MPVFQGRYRGILCDKQAYLLALIRYIHLNPVRAGLVEKAHEWRWSRLPTYLGQSQNEWLYQKDVLELFGSRPQPRLLEFLSRAPDLTPEQVYPAEALSIRGSREYVREATQQREPRRVRRRAYVGCMLPLARLGEILSRSAGVTLNGLCRSHKGPRAQTELRERFAQVATRIMFYKEAEVARFLQITPAAVTIANRRYDAKLQRHPTLADELMELLMENI